MKTTDDDSNDEEIGDITRKRILRAWDEGLALRETSERYQIPIAIVKRSLKRSLQAIIRHGVKSHVQKNIS